VNQSQLFEVFKEEANDAIGRLSNFLVDLEQTPVGEGRTKMLQEMFRYAHSLKGSAFAAQRPDIAQVAHHLESAMDKVRKGQLQPNKLVVDASFLALDLIGEGLERELTAVDIDKAGKALTLAQGESADATGHGSAPAHSTSAAPVQSPAPSSDDPKGQAAVAVEALFQAMSQVSRGEMAQLGAALDALDSLMQIPGMLELRRLGRVCTLLREGLAYSKSRNQLERTALQGVLIAVDYIQSELTVGGTDEEAEAVVALLRPVSGGGAAPTPPVKNMPVAPPPAGNTAPPSQQGGGGGGNQEPGDKGAKGASSNATVRVPVALIDAVLYRLDELIAVKLRIDHQRRQVEESQEIFDQLLTNARIKGSSHEMKELPLEEVKRKLEHIRRELSSDVHNLGILVHSLQEDVKEVRMVPVGPLLEPFRRTVRELAASLGKEAVLEIQGEDVRVDKRLLEMMRDPLLHLLRNSVDHGLETPKERIASGKSPTGIIRIIAESRESQVLLQIRDDGRGIDVERVRETAIERGLIDRDRAASLTHREVLNFIFMPGFSTRATVTETSGRGVGLDVVRENVARLGGRIDFYSDKGQRTEFLVSLPLTLAATRGLFVGVGRNIFCIPLNNVDEALAVESKDLGAAQGKLFLQHRHQAIPFIRLDDVLTGRPTQRPERRSFAVIVVLSERRLALGVDELLGQEEVVVKALSAGTPKLPMVAGGTTLADGRLVTVLEPGPLMDAASGMSARNVEQRSREHVSTVLVCDDALTTRTMIASVLERAGYRTVTAPDGETGYGVAMREGVNLIVSDVEMPILDGLGLCKRIRATPQLSNTPIILITSLGEKQELARGAEAGATAYIVKKDFDPSAFLEIVSDLVGEARKTT
jgi:two-component system chemotaxis sensor kinase CheA